MGESVGAILPGDHGESHRIHRNRAARDGIPPQGRAGPVRAMDGIAPAADRCYAPALSFVPITGRELVMAKRVLIVLGVVALLAVGVAATAGETATTSDTATWTDIAAAAPSCSFNSDCKYGKCGGGKCGYCDFNSDCNGYGICNEHQCGYCNFTSECGAFGDCSNHHCTKAPW